MSYVVDSGGNDINMDIHSDINMSLEYNEQNTGITDFRYSLDFINYTNNS